MNIFEGVKFNNSFAKLSEEFYTKQKWSSFEKAHLISFNKGLAKDLGLNPDLKPEELVKIFNGEVEASRVSAEWHGWLHRTWDEPPTKNPLPKKSWEIDHKPNLTGSLASYKPAGSLKRREIKERRDYEAWSPE